MSPGVLFLDEPTTGLDTTTAESVIQMLHKLALLTKPRTHTGLCHIQYVKPINACVALCKFRGYIYQIAKNSQGLEFS